MTATPFRTLFDPSSPRQHVHFVGICGARLRGLAAVLAGMGHRVTGSDRSLDRACAEQLAKAGIRTFSGHAREQADGAEVLVYTQGCPPDNPELLAVPPERRIEGGHLLGEWTATFPRAVGVCGTHGKTTTTALLSWALERAGRRPSFLIGSQALNWEASARAAASDVIVYEACEYRGAFLHTFPTIILLNNIEHDHPDAFPTVDALVDCFRGFVRRLPADGVLVYNADSPPARTVAEDAPQAVAFGLQAPDAAWRAADIELLPSETRFRLKSPLGEVAVTVPLLGTHNVYNTVGALTVAALLGAPFAQLPACVEGFLGTGRRFQHRGFFHGAPVYEDYAHHPTAVAVTLETARRVAPERRLKCVFQPHTFSRTQWFLREFAESLATADEVLLLNVYGARESGPERLIQQLLEEIAARGAAVHYVPTFDEASLHLQSTTGPQDVLIFLGAGDITRLADQVLAGGAGPATSAQGA